MHSLDRALVFGCVEHVLSLLGTIFLRHVAHDLGTLLRQRHFRHSGFVVSSFAEASEDL